MVLGPISGRSASRIFLIGISVDINASCWAQKTHPPTPASGSNKLDLLLQTKMPRQSRGIHLIGGDAGISSADPVSGGLKQKSRSAALRASFFIPVRFRPSKLGHRYR